MTHIIINSGRNLHEKLKCDTLFQHELVLKRIKNYENIKEIILKYADPDDDLEFSKEVWEDGKCVGFINLLYNCYNTGCYAQMLEEINNELRSVEGEIEFDIEGALYDVDDFK